MTRGDLVTTVVRGRKKVKRKATRVERMRGYAAGRGRLGRRTEGVDAVELNGTQTDTHDATRKRRIWARRSMSSEELAGLATARAAACWPHNTDRPYNNEPVR